MNKHTQQRQTHSQTSDMPFMTNTLVDACSSTLHRIALIGLNKVLLTNQNEGGRVHAQIYLTDKYFRISLICNACFLSFFSIIGKYSTLQIRFGYRCKVNKILKHLIPKINNFDQIKVILSVLFFTPYHTDLKLFHLIRIIHFR